MELGFSRGAANVSRRVNTNIAAIASRQIQPCPFRPAGRRPGHARSLSACNPESVSPRKGSGCNRCCELFPHLATFAGGGRTGWACRDDSGVAAITHFPPILPFETMSNRFRYAVDRMVVSKTHKTQKQGIVSV